MMDEPGSTVAVLVSEEEQDRFVERFRREEVAVDTLRDRLGDFLGKMDAALGAIPRVVSGYVVHEVTLSLEVSAKGKVALIGTGAELTGTGGLILTLRREAGG